MLSNSTSQAIAITWKLLRNKKERKNSHVQQNIETQTEVLSQPKQKRKFSTPIQEKNLCSWLLKVTVLILVFETALCYSSVHGSWSSSVGSSSVKAGSFQAFDGHWNVTVGYHEEGYTYFYTTAFTDVPTLIFGIKDMNSRHNLRVTDYLIRCSVQYNNRFGVVFRQYTDSNAYNVDIAFLAIRKSSFYDNEFISMIDVASNHPSTDSTLNISSSSSVKGTYSNTIDVRNFLPDGGAYTFHADPIFVAYLVRFHFTSSGSSEIDLSFSISRAASRSISVSIEVGYDVDLSMLGFNLLIIDPDHVNPSLTYTVRTFTFDAGTSGTIHDFIYLNSNIARVAILGFSGFKAANGDCRFDYNYDYDNTTGVYTLYSDGNYAHANFTCGLSQATSTLLAFGFHSSCPSGYQFFNQSTIMCQDGCPQYQLENYSSYTCEPCHYTCQHCTTVGSSNSCSQCESAAHRTLNGLNECACDDGYFDDGFGIHCRPCSDVVSDCSHCAYTLDGSLSASYYEGVFGSGTWQQDIMVNFTCDQCTTANYFYNSTSQLCQACSLPDCVSCVSLTECGTCSSSGSITLYNGSCFECSLANCVGCSSDNVCAECSSTDYELIAGECVDCSVNCGCGGWVLPKVSGVCSTVCGDGYVKGTEQCDDANTDSHDGCDASCQTESCDQSCLCGGWVGTYTNGSCDTICGDGFQVGSEECDDGNTVSHDGCDSNCLNEPCDQSCLCDGWVGAYTNGSCDTLCGDGFQVGSEECDDGNTDEHDGCTSSCTIEACHLSCLCDGWEGTYDTGAGECTGATCGDGLLRGGEQCDDSNLLDHDGCSSSCSIESCDQNCSCDGWLPPFQDGFCAALCGDGLLRGVQTCDDSNAISHDGCSSECQIQTCDQNCSCDGWTGVYQNGLCGTICGDGLLRGMEECEPSTLDPLELRQCDPLACIFIQVAQEPLLTAQQTRAASLGMFAVLGTRIAGMETLGVLQNVQLVMESSQDPQVLISNQIHGYSDNSNFPFEMSEDICDPIFERFNFMFLLILVVFGTGLFIKGLSVSICTSSNRVANAQNILQTNTDSLSSPKKFPQEVQNEHYTEEDSEQDFTVHVGKSRKTFTNFGTTIKTANTSSGEQAPQSSTKVPSWLTFSKLSQRLLNQVLFNLLINCQYIFMTALIKQILHTSFEKAVLNITSLFVIGSFFLMNIGLLTLCYFENPTFGENQNKFKENRWIKYWLLVSVERFLFAIIIAVDSDFTIEILLSTKVVLFGLFLKLSPYYHHVQKYRSWAVQSIHTLFLTMCLLDRYLEFSEIFGRQFLGLSYISILALLILITVSFLVREIVCHCNADCRMTEQQMEFFENDYLEREIQLQNNDSGMVFDARNSRLKEHSFSPQSVEGKLNASNLKSSCRSKKSYANTNKYPTKKSLKFIDPQEAEADINRVANTPMTVRTPRSHHLKEEAFSSKVSVTGRKQDFDSSKKKVDINFDNLRQSQFEKEDPYKNSKASMKSNLSIGKSIRNADLEYTSRSEKRKAAKVQKTQISIDLEGDQDLEYAKRRQFLSEKKVNGDRWQNRRRKEHKEFKVKQSHRGIQGIVQDNDALRQMKSGRDHYLEGEDQDMVSINY